MFDRYMILSLLKSVSSHSFLKSPNFFCGIPSIWWQASHLFFNPTFVLRNICFYCFFNRGLFDFLKLTINIISCRNCSLSYHSYWTTITVYFNGTPPHPVPFTHVLWRHWFKVKFSLNHDTCFCGSQSLQCCSLDCSFRF